MNIKDTYLKIKELGENDIQALREEYKEGLEANEAENKHLHVLNINQIKLNS